MPLSEKLFWDINFQTLDINHHKEFILERVLSKGNLNERYGIDGIKKMAPSIRNLDLKSASFISTIFDIPIKNFKCYSQKQSGNLL